MSSITRGSSPCYVRTVLIICVVNSYRGLIANAFVTLLESREQIEGNVQNSPFYIIDVRIPPRLNPISKFRIPRASQPTLNFFLIALVYLYRRHPKQGISLLSSLTIYACIPGPKPPTVADPYDA